MAQSAGGRISLCVSIRLDHLARVRRGGHSAGAYFGACVSERCRGVREALTCARFDGAWLSAWSIRPGTRLNESAGNFSVGNTAGEAVPAIAEGINMAIGGRERRPASCPTSIQSPGHYDFMIVG
jgi:menaquinone-9 beta-reductase